MSPRLCLHPAGTVNEAVTVFKCWSDRAGALEPNALAGSATPKVNATTAVTNASFLIGEAYTHPRESSLGCFGAAYAAALDNGDNDPNHKSQSSQEGDG